MSKTLVAYFSASGTTKALAKDLSSFLQGDLHEILPVQPYTKEDLDWQNDQCRSSVEMKDKAFRPAVQNKVDHMEDYDVIYLGFPIWWYVAPTIVNTFLEQYDLSNKTIIPFATSGSSPMGNTVKELQISCPNAIVLPGKRFAMNTSKEELKTWLSSSK